LTDRHHRPGAVREAFGDDADQDLTELTAVSQPSRRVYSPLVEIDAGSVIWYSPNTT
jgi:hypothetical protein